MTSHKRPRSPHDQLPLVSVVVTTHNRRDLVCEALDSILAQDYPNMDVIVVDDGSSDGTGEMLQEKYGDRIHYIWQENSGPASARNAGIEAATGDYVAFADDDDIWLPGKLEAQIRALEQHPECGFAYGLALTARADGQPTGEVFPDSGVGITGDNFELMLRSHPILEPLLVLRRHCLDLVGLMDEELRATKDKDFFLRLTMHYPGVYVDQPLLLVRQHAGRKTISDQRQGLMYRCRAQTYQKLLELLTPERERYRPLVRQRLAEARMHAAFFGEEGAASTQEALDPLYRVLSEHWDDVSGFEWWQDLVRLALKRETQELTDLTALVREVGRDAGRDSRAHLARLVCAWARQVNSQLGNKERIALSTRALRLHPVVWARHLALPAIGRATGLGSVASRPANDGGEET